MIGRSNDPVALTAPFWQAVADERLVRPVCGRCGASFFSPQIVCPHCQSPDWDWQPSSGVGNVYSHTTIHRAPEPGFDPPYVVADVELDEGWRMFTWIVDCSPDDVSIAMAVRVRFFDGPGGRRLPGFAPA